MENGANATSELEPCSGSFHKTNKDCTGESILLLFVMILRHLSEKANVVPRTNEYTWRISRSIGHRNEFVSMRTCTSCETAPIQNDMLPFGHKFYLKDI